MATKRPYILAFATGIMFSSVSVGAPQVQPAAAAEAERSWHSPSLTT